MASLVITIDTESNKKVRVGDRLRHVDYVGAIDAPIRLLLDIARRSALRYTFFLPLGELLPDYPEVVELVELILIAGHDIQAHRHLPFPIATLHQIIDWLSQEVELFERYTGYRPIAIRAGGYSVGQGAKWIRAILACGFRIDSSVWAGANAFSTAIFWDRLRTIEEGWWGRGALEFDFRGAPLAGSYFCDWENLARIGDSQLLEIPIALQEYDERDPWQYKSDPDWQDGRSLVRMLASMAAAEKSGHDLILNMAWHSASASYWDGRLKRALPFEDRIHYPRPGLRAFTHFARSWQLAEHGMRSICLRDIEPAQVIPCVLWGRHQSEYWHLRPETRRVAKLLSRMDVTQLAGRSRRRSQAPGCEKGQFVCPTGHQAYPVIDKIPGRDEQESDPFLLTLAMPRRKRSLWRRIRAQAPIYDLLKWLTRFGAIVGDAAKLLFYVLLALILLPVALWNALLGQRHRSPGQLLIPPKYMCACGKYAAAPRGCSINEEYTR